MRPLPEITFEMRRPMVEMRIAIRHAIRDVRDTWSFVRAAYRNRDVSAEEKLMWERAAYDAATGGDTVQSEEFVWRARSKPYGERGARSIQRPGIAMVQKRGPHFHDTVQA